MEELKTVYELLSKKVVERLEKEKIPSKKTLRMISLLNSLYVVIDPC